MTIGKDWRRRQQEQADQRIRGDVEKARASVQKFIDAIPAAIDAALGAGKDSIEIGFPLTHEDFTCGDGEKCLMAIKERPQQGLLRSDLAGRALILFDWCVANDLECALESRWEKIPYDGGEYRFNLRAKPR